MSNSKSLKQGQVVSMQDILLQRKPKLGCTKSSTGPHATCGPRVGNNKILPALDTAVQIPFESKNLFQDLLSFKYFVLCFYPINLNLYFVYLDNFARTGKNINYLMKQLVRVRLRTQSKRQKTRQVFQSALEKNFLPGGYGFSMSDVISGGLLGHLGPLCLALGVNRQVVVFC